MKIPSYENFLYLQELANSKENDIRIVRFRIDTESKDYSSILTIHTYKINTTLELSIYLISEDVQRKLYSATISIENPISRQTYEASIKELHEKIRKQINNDFSDLNKILEFLRTSYNNLDTDVFINGAKHEST